MATSQPLPSTSSIESRDDAGHSFPLLMPVIIIIFLFLSFLSIFLLRDLIYYLITCWLCYRACRRRNNAGPMQNNNAAGDQQGLDPVIISSFPTLPYSAVRGMQEGKCSAECPVCLSEFNGGDVIRLLTVCCHAFHLTCIDSWLAMQATCPVCRSDLQAPPDEAAVMAIREAVGDGGGEDSEHVIDVVEEERKEELRENEHEERGGEAATSTVEVEPP